MRRITLWLTSTAAILVLLFSYRTSTMGAGGSDVPVIASGTGTSDTGGVVDAPTASPTSIAPSTAATGAAAGSSSPSAKTSAAATPTAKATTAAPAPSAAKVVTGPSVDTRWGPVQVAITVKDNKITAVAVPVYPNGNNRDAEINSYALPVLVKETLSAQSAQINAVSGASVTSNGYISSLQSAIDAANL